MVENLGNRLRQALDKFVHRRIVGHHHQRSRDQINGREVNEKVLGGDFTAAVVDQVAIGHRTHEGRIVEGSTIRLTSARRRRHERNGWTERSQG